MSILEEFGDHQCEVCGTDCVFVEERIEELQKRIADLTVENERLKAPVSDEWKYIPNTQGWWWHWNGHDCSPPFMYYVMKSGTANGRFFIAYPDSRWCDTLYGFWKRAIYPDVPTREEQEGLIAARAKETQCSK